MWQHALAARSGLRRTGRIVRARRAKHKCAASGAADPGAGVGNRDVAGGTVSRQRRAANPGPYWRRHGAHRPAAAAAVARSRPSCRGGPRRFHGRSRTRPRRDRGQCRSQRRHARIHFASLCPRDRTKRYRRRSARAFQRCRADRRQCRDKTDAGPEPSANGPPLAAAAAGGWPVAGRRSETGGRLGRARAAGRTRAWKSS